jgi:hypothetical protein
MNKKQFSTYLLIFLSATQLLVAQPTGAKLLAAQPTRVETLRKNVAQKIRSFANKAKKMVQKNPFIVALSGAAALLGAAVLLKYKNAGAQPGAANPLNPGPNNVGSGGGNKPAAGAVQQEPCDICRNGLEIEENNVRTPCNHIFHKICLNWWLGNKPACPRCETVVPRSIIPGNEIENTPLIVATENGDFGSAEALINSGAQVNAQNIFGQTALMVAASRGDHDMVVILGLAGAQANIQNNDNLTASQIARAEGHEGIANELAVMANNLQRWQERYRIYLELLRRQQGN